MTGQVALVTGAAQRLGREMAVYLASRGYAVAVHYYRSAGPAEALAAELQVSGHGAEPFQADLANVDAVKGLIDRIEAHLGAPTCLVNSASVFQQDTAHDLSLDIWHEHLDVHLRAPALLAQAMARALPAGADGLIVNMLDEAVHRPGPSYFSYTVSKAALAAMTEMLAQALAPRIRVNGIAPGLILNSGHPSEQAFQRAHRNTLLGRGPDAEAIVRALAYLVEQTEVTGEILYVDGGKRLMQTQKYVPAETGGSET
ncbi:MAG TPA: SDR family oxidoreductase [Alphaproteobacteria bacterium]|nr:SDR family oxidoreductase [Alphaproteobacteria bacterium]